MGMVGTEALPGVLRVTRVSLLASLYVRIIEDILSIHNEHVKVKFFGDDFNNILGDHNVRHYDITIGYCQHNVDCLSVMAVCKAVYTCH